MLAGRLRGMAKTVGEGNCEYLGGNTLDGVNAYLAKYCSVLVTKAISFLECETLILPMRNGNPTVKR